MTQLIMPVTLSYEPASPAWGEKALVSATDKGMTVHLSRKGMLCAVQSAGRKIDGQGIRNVVLSGSNWDLETSWAFWQGFRGPKGARSIEWPELPEADKTELEHRIRIIDWVRDVINTPAEEQSPEQLAQRAIDLLCGVSCDSVGYRIIKGDDLREQGYMGIHTVGRGSVRPPVLLALDYNPGKQENAPVFASLVGKGITFDSGGYSLKPTSSMDSMKSDMGGAATLTGALAMAISRGLQKRVKLYLCIADNLVSGNAFKLGDIIRYSNGKSVEIMNTDAEGRLVLADGLIDATATGAPLIIDAATLTGAAVTALGDNYNALFALDHDLLQQAQAVAAEVSEPVWPLPLEPWHQEMCPSAYADTANSRAVKGGGAGGASNAAGFLSRFAPENGKGWLHIDLAASFADSSNSLWAAGATGQGVATIARLLLTRT